MQEEIADAAAGTPLGLSAEEVKALLAEAVKLEKTTLGTERHRQFTKINVILGRHRNPGEPCGCDCQSCAACSGPTERAPMLEAEYDDPKVN